MDEKEKKGKQASVNGTANEYLVLAALMKRYYNTSVNDSPGSTYDLIIPVNDISEKELFIRAQIKTISKDDVFKFTSGSRGGKDRKYLSDVKTYTHS